MFVSPQNLYFDTQTPKMMLLGGGAIEKWLDHESGALVNGISAHIRG